MNPNSVLFGSGDTAAFLPLCVRSDNEVRVLLGCEEFLLKESRQGKQLQNPIKVHLGNGKWGTQMFTEDWAVVLRFPDGSERRVDKDGFAATDQIVSKALKTHITAPYEPKIGKKEQKHADAVGRAKVDCMAFNERYDRLNRLPYVGDMFDSPGMARKKYGKPAPEYAFR